MAKKTIAEQVSAFENTRAAKAARMEEIMETAGDKGETLNADQTQGVRQLGGRGEVRR